MTRTVVCIILLVLTSTLFTLSLSQLVPDCLDRGEETVCIGHSSDGGKPRAIGLTVAAVLEDAHIQFCGCRYIRDNVVIAILPTYPDFNEPLVESNFSFLYHVREISGYLELNFIPTIERLSLPNLRLIRGNNLRSDRYGLAVLDANIQTLHMPILTEISRGSVVFFQPSGVAAFCNVLSVNWADIAPANPSQNIFDTSNCNNADIINCTALGCSSGHCWCNETNCCQNLTFIDCNCNGNRCNRNGQSIQCCNSDCAAGCRGGSDEDCQACRNLLDRGRCTDRCEPRVTINDNNEVVPNPNFRFEAAPLCVRTCPDMFFEFSTSCVEQCPINYMSVPAENGTMRCILCDGPCPRECPGIFVTESNAGQLAGCTLITGSLLIGSIVNPSAVLTNLSHIQEIRGSLRISLFNMDTEFPYLSNLKIIGSDPDLIETFGCNETAERSKYAIEIRNTQLERIDLSSLERVEGAVQLVNNPLLCYLGNLSYFITNESLPNCILEGYRRPEEECVSANLSCHPQCAPERGWCWGPNDTQCVTCRNFIYERQCVPTCDDFDRFGVHLHGMSANRSCLPCHSLCNGSCSGEGPEQCTNCTSLFVRINNGEGMRCLQSCETDTYLPVDSSTGECLPCFEGCAPTYGCAGPGRTLNMTNGCRNCSTVVLDRNGEQIQCQRDQINCPLGYYREQLTVDRGIFNASTVLCHPCHELCLNCNNGPEVSNCLTCANVRASNGSCASQCDPLTEMLRTNDTQCIVSTSTPSSITGPVIGSVIAGLILAGIVVIAVVFLILCVPRMIRKSKVTLSNGVFSSPEELELFTLGKETLQPPKMAPNAARLIVAPEDELEFGKELGSGAFGTVHEGYWRPSDDKNEYHVAIKVLKNTSASASKELLQEGVVMATMDHENVVRLYCVCMSKQLMLVSQFVPLGALLDYLKKYQDRLNAHTILLFSSQIAKGMTYLETKHLVHRDLAARNVLVQTPVKVKITDFGLTRIVESDQSHYEATTSKVPFRWLPPESIRHRVFTHKTDVWSFGVTVWEILTFGARPYQGKKLYEILKILEGGHRLEQPMTCTLDLYAVLLECWLLEPESRPSFDQLVTKFEVMLNSPSQFVIPDALSSKLPKSDHDEEALTYSYVATSVLSETPQDKGEYLDLNRENPMDKEGYVDCYKETPIDEGEYIDCYKETSTDKGELDKETLVNKGGYVDCYKETPVDEEEYVDLDKKTPGPTDKGEYVNCFEVDKGGHNL